MRNKALLLFLNFLLLPTIANAQATAKVCIADIGAAPKGKIVLSGPCRLVASIPFSFTREDYEIYAKMMVDEALGVATINAESQHTQNNRDSDKTIIADIVKDFSQQRQTLCDRHPDMAVFNLHPIAGGPEFTESYPEACRDVESKFKSE